MLTAKIIEFESQFQIWILKGKCTWLAETENVCASTIEHKAKANQANSLNHYLMMCLRGKSHRCPTHTLSFLEVESGWLKKNTKKLNLTHRRWGASHSKQLKASRSGESAHPSSAQWHTEITNVNAVTKEGFGNEVNTLDKRYVIPALISLAKVGRPMLYVKHHRRK